MSTKINSRSPFYLTASEPTDTLSEYTCQDASGIVGTTALQGMQVSAEGTITDPRIMNGGIIETRSVTQFSTNSTGSTITNQSVDYGIRVPSNYTNHNQIITCNAKADQPDVTENSCNTSTSKATFSGPIPNITNLTDDTAQTISLGSFFSNGSSGAITTYEIIPRDLHDKIIISLSGSGAAQTLSLRNSGGSGTLSARVVASNSLDGCVTTSDTFTIGLSTPKSLHCTTSNSTTDAVNASYPFALIPATGVLATPPSANIGDFVEYRQTSGGSPITTVGTHTGANQTVNFFAVFTVPNGYSNAGSTLECAISAEQQGTVLRAFACGDIGVAGFEVTSDGDILQANAVVRYQGTNLTFSNVRTDTDAGKFDANNGSSKVDVDVKFDFTIPSGFSDSTSTKTCTSTVPQAPKANVCASIDQSDISNRYLLSRSGFTNKDDFCNGSAGYETDVIVYMTDGLNLGSRVCFDGHPFDEGNNKFWGVKQGSTGFVGQGAGTFDVIKINNDGIIVAQENHNCGNTVKNPDDIVF